MKNVVLAILISIGLYASEYDMIDALIEVTEQQLVIQKNLRSMLADYLVQQDRFIVEPHNKKEAEKMVIMAAQIVDLVRKQRFEHLLSPLLMEELQTFANIAHKKDGT